jgi:hypothetical protein
MPQDMGRGWGFLPFCTSHSNRPLLQEGIYFSHLLFFMICHLLALIKMHCGFPLREEHILKVFQNGAEDGGNGHSSEQLMTHAKSRTELDTKFW